TVEHRARARPAGQGTHDLGEQPTGGGERDVDDRLLLEHRSPVVGERLPPAAGDGCGAAGAPGDRLVDDDVVRPGGDVHPDVGLEQHEEPEQAGGGEGGDVVVRG